MTMKNDATTTTATMIGRSLFWIAWIGVPSQPGEVEDLLADDRTAEEAAEVEARGRDDRRQGGAQAVATDDRRLLDPLARAVRM